MPRIPYDDPIAFLVRRRFPDVHAVRSMPSIISGPSQISHEYRTQRRAEIDAYETELSELPHADLKKRFDEEKAREREEWATKARKEEEARFFNQPESRADFAYWAKAPYWTIEEALALSLGRDPSRVSWERIKSVSDFSPFVAEYGKQRTLLQRAVAMSQLTDGTLPGAFLAWAKRNRFSYPQELEEAVTAHGHQVADWKTLYDQKAEAYTNLEASHADRGQQIADAIRVIDNWQTLHAAQVKRYDDLLASHNAQATELVDAVNEVVGERDAVTAERDALKAERDEFAILRDAQAADLEMVRRALEAASPTEKALHPSIRRSLLKMVLGMAMDKFNFRAGVGKSPAPQNITDALDRQGIRLDVDTVRTRLQEAVADIDIETEKSA